MTGKKVYLLELDRNKEYCIDIDVPDDLKNQQNILKTFNFIKKQLNIDELY